MGWCSREGNACNAGTQPILGTVHCARTSPSPASPPRRLPALLSRRGPLPGEGGFPKPKVAFAAGHHERAGVKLQGHRQVPGGPAPKTWSSWGFRIRWGGLCGRPARQDGLSSMAGQERLGGRLPLPSDATSATTSVTLLSSRTVGTCLLTALAIPIVAYGDPLQQVSGRHSNVCTYPFRPTEAAGAPRDPECAGLLRECSSKHPGGSGAWGPPWPVSPSAGIPLC